MTKYSNEFKVKAIKMVLKGDSIYHVAKILNMPNTASLRRWIFHYENGGISQLLHKNHKYTPIFKQKVIEYKWLHHLSLNQTAAKFSIPNTGTILHGKSCIVLMDFLVCLLRNEVDHL